MKCFTSHLKISLWKLYENKITSTKSDGCGLNCFSLCTFLLQYIGKDFWPIIRPIYKICRISMYMCFHCYTTLCSIEQISIQKTIIYSKCENLTQFKQDFIKSRKERIEKKKCQQRRKQTSFRLERQSRKEPEMTHKS